MNLKGQSNCPTDVNQASCILTVCKIRYLFDFNHRESMRIHPRYLSKIRRLVFSRETLSGGEVARTLRVPYFTARGWFFDKGIEPDKAKEVADMLDGWAYRCRAAAAQLRKLAKKAQARNGG